MTVNTILISLSISSLKIFRRIFHHLNLNTNPIGSTVEVVDNHSEDLDKVKQNVTTLSINMGAQAIDILTLEHELAQETLNLETAANALNIREGDHYDTLSTAIENNAQNSEDIDNVLQASINQANADLLKEVGRGKVNHDT